jgi:hypothetical protein
MATRRGSCESVVYVACAFASAIGCSSSGSGSAADASTGAGSYTYSCMQGSDLCTQTTGPDPAQAGEQKACSMLSGTFAVGPCTTAGSLGCCIDATGVEEQCAYSAQEAPVLQGLCNHGKTWIAPDGGVASEAGVTGAAGFVGTWSRSGMQTVSCPTGTTMSNITGDVVIALGSGSNTIVLTQPDGCMTTYSISGDVATATPGQSCSITTEAGIAETITVTSHTLTLAANGQTLASQGGDTIDKTAAGVTCTGMSSATFTKQ